MGNSVSDVVSLTLSQSRAVVFNSMREIYLRDMAPGTLNVDSTLTTEDGSSEVHGTTLNVISVGMT